MFLDKTLEEFLKETAGANYKAGTVAAALAGSMLSATLTAKVAGISALKQTVDEQKTTLANLNQAAKSRLAELATLLEREMALPESQRTQYLVFEAPENADSTQRQKQLKESIQGAFTGFRISFDLMKLIHRLAGSTDAAVACDLETAMNLNLASLSALRTFMELALSHLANPQDGITLQDEMRTVSEKTQDLTEQIVDTVRGKIF